MANLSTLSALGRRLEGKVALITGGSTGIGETTAKLFSKHGAKVAIADVQDELGQSVIKQIGPSNSTYIHCDVTNEDDVRNAVDKTVSAYGKLDIMFNNAGIANQPKPRIIDNEKQDFERVMAVNVTGVFLGMKHAARVMIPARSGTIISSASLASGMGGAATHAYTCSKHAVVGLTRNLAIELGQYGIRVNCLSPYALATDLSKKYLGLDDEGVEQVMRSIANLKGTTLKAGDVANAALFLASDEASYVSGQNLFIDGGFGIFNSAMQVFKESPQS
ncbi:Rossmann-fold superfamily protein [Perilla frutescens var. hirtella]|uniref:Rossmann-fold superfamily protein n=1 Tax=Perilla frutescens var. hirtella TaxID=608512 RepID=A0AAD4JB49_PERFH|nr:Rossmann-fold superfamily protein [Perilla frutescens var. hirtella]KAH6830166.1 Rossmann-fold superfamily protein [Perilla frutescens var. hirtella]